MIKNCRLVLIVIFLFGLPIPKTPAQTPSTSPVSLKTKIPHLANHKFVVNPMVSDPFIQTHFRNTLGFGQALDMDLPILVIDDETVWGIRGDLMFIGLDFEYQIAFKEWMAAFVNFNIYGRLGSGVQSMLAQGVSAATNMELGWMFRLHHGDRTMLSATVNLWNSSGTIVNFYDFLIGIIEEGGLTPENQLVRKRPFLRGGGGLRYAWAASDLIGVNLLGEIAYGESVDRRESNKIYFNAGVSTDIDLRHTRVKIPVGFAVGGGVDSFPSGGDNTIDRNLMQSFLRISYTGRDDFLLSLDMTWSRFSMRQLDQTVNAAMTTINMKYFF